MLGIGRRATPQKPDGLGAGMPGTGQEYQSPQKSLIPAKVKGITVIIIILIALFAARSLFLYKVPKSEVGIIFREAVGTQGFDYLETGPGYHFKVPLVWKIYYSDYKTRTMYLGEGGADTGAENYATLTPKDKNGVNYQQDLAVRYRPDKTQLAELLELKGENYEALVVTALRGTARNVLGQYSQEDVPENRAQIGGEILAALQNRLDSERSGRLKPGYIIIEAIDVRNTDYNDKIEQKIVQKQEAKQEADQKEYVLQSAQKQRDIDLVNADAVKQAAILRSEGEAAAILNVANAKASGISAVNNAYQDMPVEYVMVKQAEALQANAANGKMMIIDPNVIGLGHLNVGQLITTGVVG